MGQPITVVEKRTPRHDVVRFETNRSLTGMDHCRYADRASAVGNRPPDELARRLFDRGGIESVHIYSNVITVDLAHAATSDGLLEIIRDLYIYYRPGVQPPSFDEDGQPTG